MADMLHIINTFGGVENLKGKKVAMTWAYSPSYGKPLSVPQGVVGLMTRFGMDVVLAHPEGYDIMPEVEEVAKKNAAENGGSFTKTNSMAEAFKDADIVYPKSWAPFATQSIKTGAVQKNLCLQLKTEKLSIFTAYQQTSMVYPAKTEKLKLLYLTDTVIHYTKKQATNHTSSQL